MSETIRERIARRAREIQGKEEADRRIAMQSFQDAFLQIMSEDMQSKFGIYFVDDPSHGPSAVLPVDDYLYRIVRHSHDMYWIQTERADSSDGHSDPFIVGEEPLEDMIIELAALYRVERG